MDGSKLTCTGIVGDGCGGGREFIVACNILTAYDPQTKEEIVLLKNITDARSISKSGCIVTIECKDEIIKFNLSLLKKV